VLPKDCYPLKIFFRFTDVCSAGIRGQQILRQPLIIPSTGKMVAATITTMASVTVLAFATLATLSYETPGR